jgi:hypothetical protein
VVDPTVIGARPIRFAMPFILKVKERCQELILQGELKIDTPYQ